MHLLECGLRKNTQVISDSMHRVQRILVSQLFVTKPTVRKPRVDIYKLFRNETPVETTVEDSPCVDVYKLFLNASPVVTTVEEVISHETITRKEPLRRSKRIAALKKRMRHFDDPQELLP